MGIKALYYPESSDDSSEISDDESIQSKARLLARKDSGSDTTDSDGVLDDPFKPKVNSQKMKKGSGSDAPDDDFPKATLPAQFVRPEIKSRRRRSFPKPSSDTSDADLRKAALPTRSLRRRSFPKPKVIPQQISNISSSDTSDADLPKDILPEQSVRPEMRSFQRRPRARLYQQKPMEDSGSDNHLSDLEFLNEPIKPAQTVQRAELQDIKQLTSRNEAGKKIRTPFDCETDSNQEDSDESDILDSPLKPAPKLRQSVPKVATFSDFKEDDQNDDESDESVCRTKKMPPMSRVFSSSSDEEEGSDVSDGFFRAVNEDLTEDEDSDFDELDKVGGEKISTLKTEKDKKGKPLGDYDEESSSWENVYEDRTEDEDSDVDDMERVGEGKMSIFNSEKDKLEEHGEIRSSWDTSQEEEEPKVKKSKKAGLKNPSKNNIEHFSTSRWSDTSEEEEEAEPIFKKSKKGNPSVNEAENFSDWDASEEEHDQKVKSSCTGDALGEDRAKSHRILVHHTLEKDKKPKLKNEKPLKEEPHQEAKVDAVDKATKKLDAAQPTKFRSQRLRAKFEAKVKEAAEEAALLEGNGVNQDEAMKELEYENIKVKPGWTVGTINSRMEQLKVHLKNASLERQLQDEKIKAEEQEEQFKEQLKSQKEEVSKLDKELQNTQKKYDDLRITATTQEQQLKEQLRSKQEETSNLQEEFRSVQQKYENLEDEANQQTKLLNEASEKVKSQEHKALNLETALHRLQQKYEDLTKRANQKEQRIAELSEQIENQNVSSAKLEKDLQAVQQQHQDLVENHSKLKDSMARNAASASAIIDLAAEGADDDSQACNSTSERISSLPVEFDLRNFEVSECIFMQGVIITQEPLTLIGEWALTKRDFDCNGQRSGFEYDLQNENYKMPQNGLYSGYFMLDEGGKQPKKYSDKDIYLSFQRNQAGSYNILGGGKNHFGLFKLTGLCYQSQKVIMYRSYEGTETPSIFKENIQDCGKSTKLKSTKKTKTQEGLLQFQEAEMEEELSCQICMDYLACTATLQCGHSFCWLCLHDWIEAIKRNKKPCAMCPGCNETISTSQIRRVIVIDKLVDKVMANLPSKRKATIDQWRLRREKGQKLATQYVYDSITPPKKKQRMSQLSAT